MEDKLIDKINDAARKITSSNLNFIKTSNSFIENGVDTIIFERKKDLDLPLKLLLILKHSLKWEDGTFHVDLISNPFNHTYLCTTHNPIRSYEVVKTVQNFYTALKEKYKKINKPKP